MDVVSSGTQNLNGPLFCRQGEIHLLVLFMTKICELSISIMDILESGFFNDCIKSRLKMVQIWLPTGLYS